MPQTAYRSCSGVFVSQTERAYSPSPRLRTLICNQTSTRGPGLPFADLHPRNT